jgi:hypothetical protein
MIMNPVGPSNSDCPQSSGRDPSANGDFPVACRELVSQSKAFKKVKRSMKLALVRFAKVVATKTPGEVLFYDGWSVKAPKDASPKGLCSMMFKKVGLTQWCVSLISPREGQSWVTPS